MANGQTGYAEINGARLYYEVVGQGHPLVFVHAWIADNTMWDGQVAALARDYRVIRYDNRGFGKTEPVDGEFSAREDLYALLKSLGVDRTYLVGCSNGGSIAMDFTLEHPDMVDALVMVSSGPGGLNLDVPMPAQFDEAEEAWKAKDWERVLELETQVWIDGQGRTPAQVDPAVREHAKAMNRQVKAYEAKGLGKAKPGLQPPAVQRLDELHLPVLIVCGDLDEPYAGAAADYMEQHIAGARKVVMHGTAHLPSLEQPAEFNRILLDFLRPLK